MKKSLIIAAFAIFAMASCSKDQILDEQKNEIGFSVVSENSTKASNVYCYANPIGSFNVYAEYTEDGTSYTKYINGMGVTGSEGNWVPASTYYWPDLGTNSDAVKMRFYSVAGVASPALTSYTEGQKPTIDYTVNSSVALQEDLLYAVAVCEERPGTDKVALNFRHALSQIDFMAKNTNGTYTVQIHALQVVNVNSKGTFTLPNESTSTKWDEHNGSVDDPENDDVTGLTMGVWTSQNTLAPYKVSFAAPINVNNSTPVHLTTASDKEFTTNSMLLVPQTTEAWDGTKGSYFALKCTIKSSGVTLHDGWAVLPIAVDWKPGRRYIYTFDFADGNGGIGGGNDPDNPVPGDKPVLIKIDYTVSVDDFDDVTSSPEMNF